jgi:hypothetical protein
MRLLVDPFTMIADRSAIAVPVSSRIGSRVRLLSRELLGPPIVVVEGTFPASGVGTIVDRSDQPHCWIVSFLVKLPHQPETDRLHVRGECYHVNIHDLDLVVEGVDQGEPEPEMLEYVD